MRETLGDKVGDQVVYAARTSLQTESAMINDHLLKAIILACEEKCENPRVDKLKLYQAFSKRGF